MKGREVEVSHPRFCVLEVVSRPPRTALAGWKPALRVVLKRALLLAVAVGLCAAGPGLAQGVAKVVSYRSPLDDSQQAYGVYLPSSAPASSDGYPVVLHGHGYGWSVSTRFSAFQMQWAEEHGWILINLNARGPNFYEGVGDVETLNVIEDAVARFGIDRSRVYLTGGSMGGTGALRHGLRHPDVFTAVMGVDGWTDYLLWHCHWYARTDCRELIEEFRRPLLEACAPLYWAGRGRWGATGHIVDGADTTVWPENGLRLREALYELSVADPGAYDYEVIYNPYLGHGRGSRVDVIYDYFLGRSRTHGRGDFCIETTRLAHGALYWGRMEAFIIRGLSGRLEGAAEGAIVSALTRNLKAFTLYLAASPAGEEEEVSVYADGFLCYQGPPAAVSFEALLDARGRLVGWTEGTWDARPGARPTDRGQELRKTAELAGPIGDAFERPFVVAYATDGPPEGVRRHRLEAEQFASAWNGFMVHGHGVSARPEDEVCPADLAGKSLVLFGTLDSSALLRRAHRMRAFPVEVREGGVTVHDPLDGDRRYLGEQFGAFCCYPNPLSGERRTGEGACATYLVICNRRWFTKPESGVAQGLGYDLEKLPWAYADYVIFNNDQSQLPFVLNVNNKPPVTCYEAAYFVEAGFFDEHWRIDRRLQLERVGVQKPEDHRLIHIAELSLTEAEDGSPVAKVTVTDAAGEPVHTARVTGRWWGDGELVSSAVTDECGCASRPAPAGCATERVSFEVVNVMATGATYDWTADAVTTRAVGWASPRQLEIAQLERPPAASWRESLPLPVRVFNNSQEGREVNVRLSAPSGQVVPSGHRVQLGAGESRALSFTWRPGFREPGACALRAEATAQAGALTVSASCPVRALIVREPALPIAVGEVTCDDIERGNPYHVAATLKNLSSIDPVLATVRCAILEARRYPAAKLVEVAPGGSAAVEWQAAPREVWLEKGEYSVRVSIAGVQGLTGTAKFAVR